MRFPTIKELINALEAFGIARVEYNPATQKFTGCEYAQDASYDAGGGIDAIDYEVQDVTVDYFYAYKMWEDYQRILAGIPPCEEEYDDLLPF